MSDFRVNAGTLRHRVTCESPRFGGAGALGDMAEEWLPIADDVPAEVEWLQGRKLLAAKAVHEEAMTRIILRYDDRVTSKTRFIDDDGCTHNIVSLLPDSLKRYWTALCKVVPIGTHS
jgi:head-tail adaptor